MLCDVICHNSSWEISVTQVGSIEYLEVAESLTSAGLLSSALPADLRLDGDQDVPVAAVQRDGGGPRDQPGGEARPHQQQHQQRLHPTIQFLVKYFPLCRSEGGDCGDTVNYCYTPYSNDTDRGR